MRKRSKGFTLMELMLVVIIIGVLVAMSAPRLTGRIDEARTVRAQSDLATMSMALDLYEFDNGSYPDTLEGLMDEPVTAPRWKGPYLKRLAADPWGRAYEYDYPGEHCVDYDLYSYGPDGMSGGEDDVTNWDMQGDDIS